MSDDLISRKAVLNILTEARVKDSILCSPAFVEMITQRIKKIPTAFDKEKVIEELEYDKEMSAKYSTGLRKQGHIEAFDEAISIVKKGGINNILL